ncbi:hypothetical protein BD779DRAFT_1551188 [Infundibulicybe gibba]|nr:hypothetical protein BD779DRAFT_1551188 [Infundibulicybe gibba]
MTEKPSLALDLPPEIISDIFVHCLPWIHSVQRGPYRRVCRRWRLIAEATPTLWTRLPRSAKALELR